MPKDRDITGFEQDGLRLPDGKHFIRRTEGGIKGDRIQIRDGPSVLYSLSIQGDEDIPNEAMRMIGQAYIAGLERGQKQGKNDLRAAINELLDPR